ncbi:MAG TPA: hypothetical protein VHG51_11285, partial [Longimicrobiaceae bacterium]|nr:hypothetical protein [Longimicrobiaceae bacterium]
VRALAALPADGGATLAPEELAELARRDALRGREVRVTADGAAPLDGTAAGIGADGALRVRLAGGEAVAVHSGTVRLLGGGIPAGS